MFNCIFPTHILGYLVLFLPFPLKYFLLFGIIAVFEAVFVNLKTVVIVIELPTQTRYGYGLLVKTDIWILVSVPSIHRLFFGSY